MDIQWVIIAKELRTNLDTTMSIDGIFHHIDRSKLISIPSMLLIARIITNPTEVGECKIILLQFEYDKKGVLGTFPMQYQIHDMDTWANRVSYIGIPLRKIKLPYMGRYTFKLFVDNEYKNEESITVT